MSYLFVIIAIVCIRCIPIANNIWSKEISKWFDSLLILCALWSLISSIQIIAPAGLKTPVYNIGLCLGFASVFAWLMFSIKYANKNLKRFKQFKYGCIVIFSFVTLIKLTNFYHGFYFSAETVTQPFVYLSVNKSLPYYMTLTFSYTASFIGFYIIYDSLVESSINTIKHKLSLIALSIPLVLEIASIMYNNSFVLGLPYEPLGVALFAISFIYASSEESNSIDEYGKFQMVDNSDIPMLITDKNNNIKYSNSSLNKLINNSSDCIRDIIRSQNSSDCNLISVNNGNSQKYFRVDKNPTKIGYRTVGYSYIIIEITEIVRMNKVVEKQKKQNLKISNACRHHLRNQASIIKGHIPDSDNKESLEKSMDRLFNISKNIPDIIEYSEPVSKKEQISIRNILKDIETDLEIHTWQELEILGDRDKIYNLVRNCIIYGDTNSSDNVHITVSENGLNFVYDNLDEFDTRIIESVKQHGEIKSDMICLNKIFSISESLFWDMNYNIQGDKLILRFDNINNDVHKVENLCDIN